jgi:hypothetical protein
MSTLQRSGVRAGWMQANTAMAEWFKAAVLTRRQEAEANIDEVDGPEGVEGRMPGIKLP